MQDKIEVGDRLQIDIESPANPFGNTQTMTMDVQDIDDGVITGEDPNWGDHVELLGGAGTPHAADAGKSGDVVEVRVHETTDDGVTYGDKYEVIYN